MDSTALLPVRQVFPAILNRETKTKDGRFAYTVSDGEFGCSIISIAPRNSTHVVVLLAALSCGFADGTSRFTVDELLETCGVVPDRRTRDNAARIVNAALDWFADAHCYAREKSSGGRVFNAYFQIVNSWRKPVRGVYEWEIEWNRDFLRYAEMAYAKFVLPVRLGMRGGRFRTTDKDNAITYSVESRLTDSTKRRCGSRFSLGTYLVRFGYPTPQEDSAHFARNIRDLDARLGKLYGKVKWEIGNAPATVEQITPSNWERAFVTIGEDAE